MTEVTHLIENPSFGGDYVQHGNGPIMVAPGWTPFWLDGKDPPHEHAQGPTARPEYKPILASQFPYRVADGDKAQCWFAFSRVMDAGIWQQIPVSAGKVYQFSVSVQAWSSNGDDPRVSDGEMYTGLGIDPWGRTDAFELGVLWTSWIPLTAEHVRHQSVAVTAINPWITLFIRTWPKWKLKHNDVYVDWVRLERIEGGVLPPTEPPTGEYPTLDEIRSVVREEMLVREPVRWPR